MFPSLFTSILLLSMIEAAPVRELGVKFEKRQSMLPTLTLEDATYQASSYDVLADIYKWENIRFAAPPLGDLRWSKPISPVKNSTLQDGSYGNACVQGPIVGLNIVGQLSDTPLGNAIDDFLQELYTPLLGGGFEDCLFLDLYVPGVAVRSPIANSLPVIHWFYGGGYVLGDKQQLTPLLPLYDGTGVISESEGQVIFVASNYRLGAFGFLAGTTMEEEGLPNAGLWDQRAALQWTRDNIHLVGGNPDAVTAMGESAGAGSIYHHLVAEGGTLDPLFSKAIMLSPAFEPYWDRKGTLQSVFEDFTSLAGCEGRGLACLRSADSATLISANTALNGAAVPGTFVVGPAADGSFIRQSPPLEYASGNYYKGIDAAVVSHCADEPELFVNGDIKTDEDFSNFLVKIFPNYTLTDGLQNIIQQQYPNVSSSGSPYDTEGDRVRAFIQDSAFTCHTRVATTAYSGKIYDMQYDVTPGWHATDLLPAFLNFDFADSALSTVLLAALPYFGSIAQVYKSYMTSFARSGDPNTYARKLNIPPAITWPTADGSTEQVKNVLNVGDLGYSLISDSENTRSACDFWVQWISAATQDGGYVPPGALVEQSLVTVSGDPSANYR